MKKLVSLFLAFALCLTFSTPVFAKEDSQSKYVNEWEVEILPGPDKNINNDENNILENPVVNGGDTDIWCWRKTNVYEWSGYYRVSDNLVTSEAGGSLCCDRSITISASISGNTSNINVTASGSVSTSIGYTLNVGPNKRVYMGYRVYKYIERGTREYYNQYNGQVLSSNSYTAISPQYGEYVLINYN